ncbi:hypothetical protein [Hyphomonas sp.]|uniref:hypothetical protein n=1 Tax=Hyphomonas sp. TaxID=87 RepID=UPI00391AF0DE
MPAPEALTLSWIAFGIGLFYTLGGIVVIRSLTLDKMLDRALEALGSETAPQEKIATRLLTAGALLTFASGLALMGLSRWAPWLFGANLAVQAAYLAWASVHMPTEDDLGRKGRRATVRAFVLYAAVFVFVLYADGRVIWREWFYPDRGILPLFMEIGLIGLFTATFAWALGRPARGMHRNAPAFDPDEYFPEDGLPPPVPKHLRLAPEFECWPTWDHETGYNADPEMLGLSKDLLEKMGRWDSILQSGYNPDDPTAWPFDSVETERRWASLGDEIADQLADEWEGPLSIQISSLTYLVNAIRDGLSPYDEGDPAGFDRAAQACGVAEIRELIRRLDILAREKATVPDWDGDTMDDIARFQSLYASLLARVHPRYRDDVEAGLQSPEEETHRWVRLALDGQAR